MLDSFKTVLANQYEAALCTLNMCIDQCPDSGWDSPVANLTFSQVAFHALFFTDYYLGQDEESLDQQPFHRDNKDFFRDYEELQDRKQELRYDRPSIKNYLEHCREKARQVIVAETKETLKAPCRFPNKSFSRAELYLYNLRHIQHHAAQLILRLRLDHNAEFPWVGSGWRNA